MTNDRRPGPPRSEREEAARSLAAMAGVETHLELPDPDEDPHALVDLVNRLLDKGVVIRGDITISVAGVDLVYLGLSAVLTSATKMRRQLGATGEGQGG